MDILSNSKMQKLIQLNRIGILALILSLLIIPAAQAQQDGIYRVNSIDIELKENGIANVREEVVVDKPEARILLPKTSRLEISDSSGKLEYKSDVIHDEQIVSFNSHSHFPASDGKVFISYTSNHLTSKAGSVWTLKFSSLATPAHTEVRLEFPTDSNVISLTPDIPKYPKNLSNPLLLYPQESQLSFECDYEAGKTSTIDSRNRSTELIIPAVVIILVIALIILILKRRKREEKIEDGQEDEPREQDIPSESTEGERKIKESVLKMLDEREKEIVRIIEKSGEEEITQAYIYKTTGIPKATLSDIMKRLESRNIVERTHDGRTKWIRVKNWIFD